MQDRTPEALGQAAAEALIANLERLKKELGGGSESSLDRQMRAGEVAVEAMKQMMAGAVARMQPPDEPR
jgi:hypothetical protein